MDIPGKCSDSGSQHEDSHMMHISRSAVYLTCAAATSEGAPSGMAAVGCNDAACQRAGRVLERSLTFPCLLDASALPVMKAHQQSRSRSRRFRGLLHCSWQIGADHLVALHEFGGVYAGLVFLKDRSQDCCLLSEVVRPRECLVAVRANVRSFLSVSSNMSKHSMSVAAMILRCGGGRVDDERTVSNALSV